MLKRSRLICRKDGSTSRPSVRRTRPGPSHGLHLRTTSLPLFHGGKAHPQLLPWLHLLANPNSSLYFECPSWAGPSLPTDQAHPPLLPTPQLHPVSVAPPQAKSATKLVMKTTRTANPSCTTYRYLPRHQLRAHQRSWKHPGIPTERSDTSRSEEPSRRDCLHIKSRPCPTIKCRLTISRLRRRRYEWSRNKAAVLGTSSGRMMISTPEVKEMSCRTWMTLRHL